MGEFRYSVRAFPEDGDEESFLKKIYDANRRNGGGSLGADELLTPWQLIMEHLRGAGAKTLLVQRDVFDPDFLEEHQAFYAHQLRLVERLCVRIHFFDEVAEEAVLLAEDNEDAQREAFIRYVDGVNKASYLGFVSLRPIRHAPIGASIVAIPDHDSPTVWDDFPVHIAGREFTVRGTPFLQQDNAVGVCAQASMWMALRSLRRRHGNSAYSPAELTVAATQYLAVDRAFPGRAGLTTGQMLDAIRFAGHDPLHIPVREVRGPATTAWKVLDAAGPYVESGLPVLMVLSKPPAKPAADGAEVEANEEDGAAGHVVVAVGLKTASSRIKDKRAGSAKLKYIPTTNWYRELTVQNDGEGPYQPLQPAGYKKASYYLEDACSLIVVLPHGVFTSAAESCVLAEHAFMRAAMIAAAESGGEQLEPLKSELILRPLLCTRHAFRRWAMEAPELHATVRDRYRTAVLPRHVWVVEIHDSRTYNPNDADSTSRVGEVVLDASADPLNADGHIFASIHKGLISGPEGQAAPGILVVCPPRDGLQKIVIHDDMPPGKRIVDAWHG